MSTPDPFGEALAAQAQSGSNPDPYGAALAAHAAGQDVTKLPDPSLWDKYVGFQEGQLAGATGGIASLAGGLGYLGRLAITGDPDAAKSTQEAIQQGLTYSPRTAEGKAQAAAMADATGYLGAKGGEIAGSKVAEVTGSPLLGAAVNTAYNVPQFLLGAKGAEKVGQGLPEPTSAPVSPVEAIRQKGADLGLVTPPSTVNPTILNKSAEGLAGKTSTAQLASIKNQPIINNAVRTELGLPEDAELSPETLAGVRAQQAPAYQAVAAVPEIKFGPDYEKELNAITSKADKITQALPDYKSTGSEQVQNLVKSLKPVNGVMDGETAVELSKSLRSEASSQLNMAARTADPAARALGTAYSKAATAVENAVQSHLESIGQPELAENWDNARRTIAKTYSVEQALDGAGNVDAAKIGKQAIKGKPLSGNLETIADFANAFPKATKVQWSKESVPGVSPLDVYGGSALGLASGLGTGHAVGALAGAAVPLGRMATRSTLLSGPGQKLLASPGVSRPGSIGTPLGQLIFGGVPADGNDQ